MRSLVAVILLIGLCGCGRHPEVRTLANGYYHYTVDMPDSGAKRWILKLRNGEDERVITEGIVVNGKIMSLMPTIQEWSSPEFWTSQGEEIDFDAVGFCIDSTGAISSGTQSLSQVEFDRSINILEKSGTYVMLYVQTPVDFLRLQSIVEAFAKIAKTGLNVHLMDDDPETPTIKNEVQFK